MDNQNKSKNTLVVWRFIDGKPGHEKQTDGLIHQLKKCLDIQVFLMNCRPGIKSLVEIILHKYTQGKNLPKPDILLGAGHTTHLEIIAAKKRFGGKSIVIMKPSLPYSMFDLCIIPKHDNPPRRKNIIISEMPLPPPTSGDPIDKNLGFFLIGGPSRHFEWSDRGIIEKINSIIKASPNKGMNWKLSTSRRTPSTFADTMRQHIFKELDFFDYRDTPSGWLELQLSNCQQVWVTQDSYSMMCEAVNLCRKVGVFELAQKKAFLFSSSKKFKQLPALPITPFENWLATSEFVTCRTQVNRSNSLGMDVLRSLGLR
jgi:mitochondrial fission protein ELM1